MQASETGKRVDVSLKRRPNGRAVPHVTSKARALIKGCGLCSFNADSVEQVMELLLENRAQTDKAGRAIPLERLYAASGLSLRDAKKVDRFSLLAIAAARRAFSKAGLEPTDAAHCGIITGNMMAGWTFTEPQLRALHKSGPLEVSPYLATAWFPAAPQGQVTIHLKLRGFAKTVTTDRCAGSQAIGLASKYVRSGRCELLLAGGVEAPLTPFVEMAFAQPPHRAQDLTEAAAYLLLARGEEGGPAIGAHATSTLSPSDGESAEEMARLISAFIARCRDYPEVSVVVCNISNNPRAENEITSTINHILKDARPRFIFPARAIGDCLAASGAIACAIACSILSQEPSPCSSLVVTVGHQCLDLLLIYQ